MKKIDKEDWKSCEKCEKRFNCHTGNDRDRLLVIGGIEEWSPIGAKPHKFSYRAVQQHLYGHVACYIAKRHELD